jgi:beta-lactamase class A
MMRYKFIDYNKIMFSHFITLPGIMENKKIAPINNHDEINNMYFWKRKYSLLLITIASCFISTSLLANTQPIKPSSAQEKLAALEASSGGRLGVYAINTANNSSIQYHAEERFPFCSTSKVMAVSAILKKSMTDNQYLQQKVMYKKQDLASYSPITEQHLTDGMTISELCAAAITHSDNTAMNLLLAQLGGPQAVTNFARSIGDTTFRLDREEPELNTAIPGDLRDTSTPKAMANSLQKLTLGNALSLPQREQLQIWLKSNTTGDARIRAGVPENWIIGDKTGTGDYGTTNDIGIIWPPKCSPIVIAIYFTQNKQDAAPRDDVIAAATRIVVNEFAQSDKCINSEN